MLKIADTTFTSRLFTGTGKFSSASVMQQAIVASGSQLVTMAMKRVDLRRGGDDILRPLQELGLRLLPNTSGAKTAEEAIFAAQLAREALGTHWVKLEIHPDLKYLLPDAVETLKAVMPLGAPIGSNQGLQTREFLRIIIEQAKVPVVVDAGIGAPSQAAEALELGADAVLVNTAIAVAGNPIAMAQAFKLAVEAGHMARVSGLGGKSAQAYATSPLTHFLENV